MSVSTSQSIQLGTCRSIGPGTELFLGSVATAVVAAILVVGAGISIVPTRSNAAPVEQLVNRVGKADRLLLPVRPTGVDSKLPRGCEPLVSPLADTQLARFARQCVS